MAKITHPTQYKIGTLEIDGNDCVGLYNMISIFENIYSPIITGSVVINDSDKNDFIGKFKIEGNEEIKFEFTNANEETLSFEGVLNGLRNKAAKNQNTVYTFDFTSIQVRKNEENFIVKRYNAVPPKDIVEEMIKKLEGKTDKVEGEGLPMSFLGSRKRPTDIIEYVLTHGVTQDSNSSDSGKQQKEESSGTTGFLCWQTLDGYRFNSIDKILAGEGGEDVGSFTHSPQNQGLSMDEAMHSVVDYSFQEIGDFQSKMRSGAFRNVSIFFDMDKGLYKEFEYLDDKNMTDKQKAIIKAPTRFMVKPYVNEKFEQSCDKASDNTHDQSKRYLSQNTVRQNTFNDQTGDFTLPPQYTIKAGDSIEIKIPKVKSEGETGYNEKHTGRYVIKQVGHHVLNDGRSYTRIQTIRSTIQQDDDTSTKS